jgi:hypothetical protein
VGATSLAGAAAPARREDSLDDALERLAGTGPEYAGGLANHGPMAAEALVALGRADAVASWVDRYRRQLRPPGEATGALRPEEWAESLGRIDRMGDWTALFERALREEPWAAVLGTWMPRLAPGLVAAATHGLIRTGHAARALGQRDTPRRRQELAQGLAYWAARYQRLPERPGAPARGRLPSSAVGSLPLLPSAARPRRGLISDSLAALEGHPSFAAAIDAVDVSGDAGRFLSDLTATFARVYLAQVPGSGRLITFVHAVTGPSAVRLLLPHLGADAQRALLRYAWQAAAGMYVAMGQPGLPVAADGAVSSEGLVEGAVATGDEHAFKFTEACLREHALDPRPEYLAAARDAVARLA